MGIFVNSLCTSRFLTTYNPYLKNLDVTVLISCWDTLVEQYRHTSNHSDRTVSFTFLLKTVS